MRFDYQYEKTKIIQFGTRNLNANTFLIGGEKIEIVKKYIYLGIIISHNGSFKCATKLRKNLLGHYVS